MRRISGVAVRAPGRMARIGLAGAVLAATSVTADAVAAAGPQAVHAQFSYTCRFPSRPRAAGVQITTTFPAAGRPGQPIRPAAADVTVAFGHAAVAEFSQRRAVAVAGTARLSILVTQNGASRSATWSGLTAAPARVPAAGGMEVSTAGRMPSVPVAAPGDVTFAAGNLVLDLFLRPAGGSSAHPGMLSLACTPAAGDDTRLATVHVSGPPPAGPSAPPRAAKAGRDWPEGCGHIRNINPGQQSLGCAYIAGFSDVNKLNGAAFVQSFPGFLNISLGPFKIVGNSAISHSLGQLDYHGLTELPPLRATLLSFGFMPTTATMHLAQAERFVHITLKLLRIPPFTFSILVDQNLSLRISNVLVNGSPLDVGPNCHAVAPVHLVLKGGSPQFVSILLGGPLSGAAAIPRFTGCGVGENLDPLFNAAISGPGNFAKITQGNVCLLPAHGLPAAGCPPVPPRPIH